MSVYFHYGDSDVSLRISEDPAVMEEFLSILRQTHASGQLRQIEICAWSCPAGDFSTSQRIARQRARNLADYITARSDIPSDMISIKETGIGWEELAALVEADPDVPGRETVLGILVNTDVWIFDSQNRVVDGRKRQLMNVAGGRSWWYMREHLFPKIRLAEALVLSEKPVEDTDSVMTSLPDTTTVPPVTPQDTVITDTALTVPAEPVIVPENAADEFTWDGSKVLLKTNIPFWAIVVPNLGVEVRLADHWSLDIPVYYSPFTVDRCYRFRTFTMQPGVRYWLNPAMRGHFFGVHLTGGAFNISVNDRERFQDTDGVWGAGVDYGYALPFNEHWGMEFNIGAGYMWTRYQTFYNIDNGAAYSTGIKNYFGITRLGISLIYKL